MLDMFHGITYQWFGKCITIHMITDILYSNMNELVSRLVL
jgi:hypothetical protein